MKVCALLVPYDSGRLDERMGRGPAYLFEHAVEPVLTGGGHSAKVVEIRLPDPFTAEIKTAFALCARVAETVRQCLRDGWFPLVLSGNCNVAIGAVTGCGSADSTVVWFDAHGEATTPETTTSGFLDGMGISILNGRCWQNIARSIPGFAPIPGDRIVLVGSRDLEPAEIDLLDAARIRRVAAPAQVAAALPATGAAYVHFDLDALDPSEARWNQWSPPEGMTIAGVVDAVRAVRSRMTLRGAGFASFDPAADADGRAGRAVAAILDAVLAG